jgi:hypothetical protein
MRLFRGGSRHFPKGRGQGLKKIKKSDFQTICFKKNQKILRCIAKHGKTKNDKDDLFLPVYNLANKGEGTGSAYGI